MPLPCGKCPACRKRRTSGWSFRLVRHSRDTKTAYFVTLTYDTSEVPLTKKGFMTLNKKHVQDFIKRLREINIKNYGNRQKITYYAVGEYGSKTMRPHYHIILFNSTKEAIFKAWKKSEYIYHSNGKENPVRGHIHIGNVQEASIGYTLKYLQKKSSVPMHKNDDRQKEFQLMSKGLGINYLTQSMVNWHKDNLTERCYIGMKNNEKIAMPRYYKDKLYNESEKNRIARHMEKEASVQDEKLLQEYGEHLHYEMSQKHINAFRLMHKKSQFNQDKL